MLHGFERVKKIYIKRKPREQARVKFKDSRDWLKFKNPNAPAVKREAEEDWGKQKWR